MSRAVPPATPAPELTRRMRYFYRLLKLVMFGTLVIVVAGPAAATPDSADTPAAPAQTEPPLPPAGCPGGPAGPAIPGTECPDGSVPTPIPAGCPGSPLSGPPTAGTTCPDGTVVPAPNDTPGQVPTSPVNDDALADMFALSSGEEHPLSAYDIGCDEGAWNAFLRKMWCGTQALPFAFGKWVIGLGTGVMSWALDFKVAESLTPVADVLSRAYETTLVGNLDIADLGWSIALLVGGLHILRARMADGLREIGVTFIIAILGGIVLANPQGYLEGSIDLAQNSSGAVLESVDGAVNGGTDQDAAAMRERLSAVLQRSFVAEPYDLINWGEPLTGECAVARDEILADGPWGGEDRPREIMRAHGCERQAEFNARPSDNRAVASFTIAGASSLVMVLIAAIALAVFAAQITLLALFSGASLAWAVALFPGGRGILWWWLSRLVWAVLITIASMFLLTWIAVTVTVLLDNTTDISIFQRSLIILVVVAVAFKFRSSIDKAIDGASHRIGSSLKDATGSRHAATIASNARIAKDAIAEPSGGFKALSWSPASAVLSGAAAGLSAAAAARNFARSSHERSRSVAQGSRRVGSSALRGGRAVARAPVQLPSRVSQARARATQRSLAARETLRRARHPVAAGRAARESASSRASDTMDWM